MIDIGIYMAIGMLIIATISAYALYAMEKVHDKDRQQWQQERKDLLDRLMARDLPEVKQAQAMEARTGVAKSTSKRQNDARLMAMAEKVERE